MASGLNINEINAKMQSFQAQLEQYTKMQQQLQDNKEATPGSPPPVQTPSGSTYPKVFRHDTVEGILENPQWQQELAMEFNGSELGAKAKSYTEVLFMEFCEKQTGVPSTKLTEMRKNAQTQEKKAPAPPKPPAAPKSEEAKG